MEGVIMEEERARLIERLDEAREKMRAVLVDIDTRMEIYPSWTIKHVLAHITGWDDATIASLRAHAGGDEPGTPASRGIDVYNAESVETRDALDYEHIIQEWELAREQLKDAINEMPPEKLVEPLLFPWGQTGTVAQIVAIFANHEEEHAGDVQALRAGGKHL
jgi:uncharacterized damage-inducible protein DinB